MSLQRSQFVSSQHLLRAGDGSQANPAVESTAALNAGDETFFRFDFLRSLQLHGRLAGVIAIAGLVLAAAYVARKWPVYTAESRVYIQPLVSRVVETGWAPQWPSDANTYDSFIEQQVQSAYGSDVLLNALHHLPRGAWQKSNESDAAAAQRLRNAVDMGRIGTTYEIAITARTGNADQSAQIANAMAAAMIEKTSRVQKAGNAERLAILVEERDRIQKALKDDGSEQASLDEGLGMASFGGAVPNHYDDEIGKVHDELVRARTAHDDAAAKLIALDAQSDASSKALDAEADELVATDPGLGSMKLALNQRRALLITQMANLTPNHPQYKQDAAELAQIDESLESMARDLRAKASVHIQQRVRTDLERTAGVEGRLNAQLGQLARAAASVAPKMQRANDLATDIVRLRNRHAVIDEQMHNLMLENSVPGAAHLSAAAEVPLHPTVSGIAKKVLIVSLGGVFLGLVVALVANNLDQKVYIASDIQRVLGLTPMAELPDFDEVSEMVADEHLLRLSAAIEYARQEGRLRSCIFTGTGAGAGVSTLVGRVSSMLENMGRETVLIDASWTPPHAPQPNPRGLGGDGPSGKLATQSGARSTALLHRVSEEVGTGEDSVVLTDAAPMPVSAETEYLAHFVDAVIVVAQSGVTTRAQLRATAARLQRLDVPAVGFVLNRITLKNADPTFRHSAHVAEQYLRVHRHSSKQDLGDLPKQNKRHMASESPAAISQNGDLPRPETHVFYLPEWKANNPDGDVEAARQEAIRLGYEVVER